MKINDASNQELSLYHLCLRWALTTSTEFPFDPEFLQSANMAMDKVNALIKRYDNTWEFVDMNNTDPVIETINLTSGTQSYPILSKYKKLRRIRVKDRNGNFYTLTPKSRAELSDDILNSTGSPEYCDKIGNKIYMFPNPDYSYSSGIEIEFQPGGVHFVDTDTTKEPGFDSEYHELIALYPALDFCEINGKDKQATKIRNRIGQEPRQGVEGTGLLGALAAAYLERDAGPQSLSISKSNRGISTLT